MQRKRTKEETRRYYINKRLKVGALRPDYDQTPQALARGRTLALMEQLPLLNWPKSLYGDAATIEDLLTDDATTYQVPKIGRVTDLTLKCHCGCGEDHKNRVAGTTPSPYGGGHNVYWFAGQPHKDKWIRNGRK